MKPVDVIKPVVSIVVCEGAGGIGAIFTTPAIPTWYEGLEKPAFTPPNTVFGPVWITLYLLMGIAAYLVWRKGLDGKAVRVALSLFLLQLVLNVLWSGIFFGLRAPFWGLVIIGLLWVAILVTTVRFFRVSTAAGALLIPYLVWTSIASYLNAGVWMLN